MVLGENKYFLAIFRANTGVFFGVMVMYSVPSLFAGVLFWLRPNISIVHHIMKAEEN